MQIKEIESGFYYRIKVYLIYSIRMDIFLYQLTLVLNVEVLYVFVHKYATAKNSEDKRKWSFYVDSFYSFLKALGRIMIEYMKSLCVLKVGSNIFYHIYLLFFIDTRQLKPETFIIWIRISIWVFCGYWCWGVFLLYWCFLGFAYLHNNNLQIVNLIGFSTFTNITRQYHTIIFYVRSFN